jgi:hypothetical protein
MPYLKELLKPAFFKSRLFLDHAQASVVMELNCGIHYLNAIDAVII